MSKLILENQHLPKLTKINPPENPYHPAASGTSTQISRLFLLNDRGKVTLTESSSQSEPEQSNQASPQRFPTFQNPCLHLPDIDDSPHTQSPSPLSKTGSFQFDHKFIPSFQSQNKETQLVPKQQSFVYSQTPLFNEKQQNTQNQDKVFLSNLPLNLLEKPQNIYNRYHQATEETHKYRQQDIADEEQTQNLVIPSIIPTVSQPLSSAIKPVLQSANKALSPISSQNGTDSLIEQLQIDNLFQSQIVQNQQNKNNQTNTNKRKFKIFRNCPSRRTPSPSPNFNTISQVQKQYPQHQMVSEFEGERVQKNQNKGRGNNYLLCPHAQCILKSLQIIDKLTDQKQSNVNPQPKDKHISIQQEHRKLRADEEIEVQSLDISLQMDKFLLDLTLESLDHQETTKMIKQIKIAINKLVNKIKNRNSYQNIKAFMNWQLCDELQQICNILHCVQVLQERYKMWKLRLYHLKQRIKDILSVNQQQQMQKITDMKSHIQELHGSKYYGSDINIAVHYNQFIDQQLKQLEGAIESIQTIILKH